MRSNQLRRQPHTPTGRTAHRALGPDLPGGHDLGHGGRGHPGLTRRRPDVAPRARPASVVEHGQHDHRRPRATPSTGWSRPPTRPTGRSTPSSPTPSSPPAPTRPTCPARSRSRPGSPPSGRPTAAPPSPPPTRAPPPTWCGPANPNFQSPATATGAGASRRRSRPWPPRPGATATHRSCTPPAAGVPEVWNIFHHLGARRESRPRSSAPTASPASCAPGSRAPSTSPPRRGRSAPVRPTSTPRHPWPPPTTRPTRALIYISVLVDRPHPHWSVGLLCINLETRSTCGYTAS